MATSNTLTTAQLKQALQIREQIDALQEKLDAVLGGAATTKQKVVRTKGKRTISAEHRAKLAAAQKARWAKTKGASASAPIKMVAKKKGGITAEGRAKLAAAMKARWATRKKAA